MTSDWMHDDPERAAMSTLSDMLGIPHFTTSRGSTVRGDFITAVARALGARDEDFLRSPDHPLMPGRPGKNKDEILALAWELARQEPMPEDMISSGETITDAHLEGIIDGVVRNGVSPLLVDDTSEGGFHSMEDHRRRQVAERAVRDGQWAFRDAVFDAYGGRCALTGANLPAALQAAHIAPYMGPKSNSVSNGICLRADIHAMFDRHMLAIHEDSYRVLLSPAVLATNYREFDGRQISTPWALNQRPDLDALRHHRLAAGLG